MKKRIPTIIILSLCAIYLSVMPVMAQERSTTDQGLTLTFPDTYSSYSKDEYIQMRQDAVSNKASNITGDINKYGNISGGWGFIIDIGGQFIGDAVSSDTIQEAADTIFADNTQFIISNDLDEDICSVYRITDATLDLAYWSCYSIRESLFSDDNGKINKFLKNKKYSCNPVDAIIVEPSNGNLPYIQISGTSSDSSQSYILTEFLHDGYEYRIFLDYNGSTIPTEMRNAYNGIIDSVNIGDSPNKSEINHKYYRILKPRVELTD